MGGELGRAQHRDVFAVVAPSDVSLGVTREAGITAGSAQFVSFGERGSVWVSVRVVGVVIFLVDCAAGWLVGWLGIGEP